MVRILGRAPPTQDYDANYDILLKFSEDSIEADPRSVFQADYKRLRDVIEDGIIPRDHVALIFSLNQSITLDTMLTPKEIRILKKKLQVYVGGGLLSFDDFSDDESLRDILGKERGPLRGNFSQRVTRTNGTYAISSSRTKQHIVKENMTTKPEVDSVEREEAKVTKPEVDSAGKQGDNPTRPRMSSAQNKKAVNATTPKVDSAGKQEAMATKAKLDSSGKQEEATAMKQKVDITGKQEATKDAKVNVVSTGKQEEGKTMGLKMDKQESKAMEPKVESTGIQIEAKAMKPKVGSVWGKEEVKGMKPNVDHAGRNAAKTMKPNVDNTGKQVEAKVAKPNVGSAGFQEEAKAIKPKVDIDGKQEVGKATKAEMNTAKEQGTKPTSSGPPGSEGTETRDSPVVKKQPVRAPVTSVRPNPERGADLCKVVEPMSKLGCGMVRARKQQTRETPIMSPRQETIILKQETMKTPGMSSRLAEKQKKNETSKQGTRSHETKEKPAEKNKEVRSGKQRTKQPRTFWGFSRKDTTEATASKNNLPPSSKVTASGNDHIPTTCRNDLSPTDKVAASENELVPTTNEPTAMPKLMSPTRSEFESSPGPLSDFEIAINTGNESLWYKNKDRSTPLDTRVNMLVSEVTEEEIIVRSTDESSDQIAPALSQLEGEAESQHAAAESIIKTTSTAETMKASGPSSVQVNKERLGVKEIKNGQKVMSRLGSVAEVSRSLSMHRSEQGSALPLSNETEVSRALTTKKSAQRSIPLKKTDNPLSNEIDLSGISQLAGEAESQHVAAEGIIKTTSTTERLKAFGLSVQAGKVHSNLKKIKNEQKAMNLLTEVIRSLSMRRSEQGSTPLNDETAVSMAKQTSASSARQISSMALHDDTNIMLMSFSRSVVSESSSDSSDGDTINYFPSIAPTTCPKQDVCNDQESSFSNIFTAFCKGHPPPSNVSDDLDMIAKMSTQSALSSVADEMNAKMSSQSTLPSVLDYHSDTFAETESIETEVSGHSVPEVKIHIPHFSPNSMEEALFSPIVSSHRDEACGDDELAVAAAAATQT